jgi:hypothetical protein
MPEKVPPWVRQAGLALAAIVVFLFFLDFFGIFEGFGDDDEPVALGQPTGHRPPGEHLYLDDERVDAYLSQLRGGFAATEQQSVSVKRTRNTELALQQGVQVGASVEEEQAVQRTVESRAADRFYLLEAELLSRFGQSEHAAFRFRRVRARAHGCRQIKRGVIKPGQIIRITGAHLRVPTYALALAKVAHAAQFRASHQGENVNLEALSELAGSRPKSLQDFVEGFGTDPRLPFRLEMGSCTVFLPARYSKLVDAPSLLTGQVTVVGKVVRTLTGTSKTYFDVETAARYGRAVQDAARRVQDVLLLSGAEIDVVNESARVAAPAIVVVPLAIYK